MKVVVTYANSHTSLVVWYPPNGQVSATICTLVLGDGVCISGRRTRKNMYLLTSLFKCPEDYAAKDRHLVVRATARAWEKVPRGVM